MRLRRAIYVKHNIFMLLALSENEKNKITISVQKYSFGKLNREVSECKQIK